MTPLLVFCFLLCVASTTSLSLPPSANNKIPSTLAFFAARSQHKELNTQLHEAPLKKCLAMAIPGNTLLEETFVGGFGTFLMLYNYLITFRILLSWIPQSQGVAILQPVFTLTDPFLNTFRGLVPAIAGIDLSPLLGFFLLNVLMQATASVGCELPAESAKKTQRRAQRKRFT